MAAPDTDQELAESLVRLRATQTAAATETATTVAPDAMSPQHDVNIRLRYIPTTAESLASLAADQRSSAELLAILVDRLTDQTARLDAQGLAIEAMAKVETERANKSAAFGMCVAEILDLVRNLNRPKVSTTSLTFSDEYLRDIGKRAVAEYKRSTKKKSPPKKSKPNKSAKRKGAKRK
jgi:hypothetical protein